MSASERDFLIQKSQIDNAPSAMKILFVNVEPYNFASVPKIDDQAERTRIATNPVRVTRTITNSLQKLANIANKHRKQTKPLENRESRRTIKVLKRYLGWLNIVKQEPWNISPDLNVYHNCRWKHANERLFCKRKKRKGLRGTQLELSYLVSRWRKSITIHKRSIEFPEVTKKPWKHELPS